MVKLGSVAAAVFYLIVVKAFFRESKSFSYCHNSAAVYHKCNGLASVFGGSLDKSTAAAGAELLPAFSVGGSGISSAFYPAAVGNILSLIHI